TEIERQEQSAGLTCNRIAVVHTDVCARIKREKPMIGQTYVQHRIELQVADVLFRRVAREAKIVAHDAFKIAARTQFRQHGAGTNDGHHLPFAARNVIRAGWSDDSTRSAGSPALVDLLDKRRLKIHIAHTVKVVARWVIRRDRILGNKRQIAPKYHLPR